MTVMAILGTTTLDAFPLCLGGNVFGWTADEETSFAILDAYAEAGGNFIDTADVYSAGESEEIVAKAIKGRRDVPCDLFGRGSTIQLSMRGHDERRERTGLGHWTLRR